MDGETEQAVAAVSAVSGDVSQGNRRPTFAKEEKQNMAAAGLSKLSKNNTRPAFVQEKFYGSVIAETILRGDKVAKGNTRAESFVEANIEEMNEPDKTLLQSIFDGKGGVVQSKA